MASTFNPSTVSSQKLRRPYRHQLNGEKGFCTSSVRVSCSNKQSTMNRLDTVKKLIHAVGVTSVTSSPQKSLHDGNWVKLICGASFEDVADIRNLSLVYTLAGGEYQQN